VQNISVGCLHVQLEGANNWLELSKRGVRTSLQIFMIVLAEGYSLNNELY